MRDLLLLKICEMKKAASGYNEEVSLTYRLTEDCSCPEHNQEQDIEFPHNEKLSFDNYVTGIGYTTKAGSSEWYFHLKDGSRMTLAR